MKQWFLIENNSHKVLQFLTYKSLKLWAKENGFKIKKSPMSDRWYYTEAHIYLPTGFKD